MKTTSTSEALIPELTGEQFRFLRKEANVTLDEMANIQGKSKAAITSLENKNSVKLGIINKFRQYIKDDIYWNALITKILK